MVLEWEVDALCASIMEESQNLMEHIFSVTIKYYQEQTISGSPFILMQNEQLVERLSRPHLMRLCFLAGVEYQLKLDQRLEALREA